MPTPVPPSSVNSGDGRQFLFLVSHGLLTPIASIRWGCGRLRKTDMKKLSDEQKHLISAIHSNAQRLSRAFGSMVLLARNEDATYEMKFEDVKVREVLEALIAQTDPLNGQVEMHCDPSLRLRADPAMFETIIQNLLSVCAEAKSENAKVTVEAKTEDGMATITIVVPLELSFLEMVRPASKSNQTQPVVGGTPGLLLSLTNSLLGFMDGSLDMESKSESTYTITARLPY